MHSHAKMVHDVLKAYVEGCDGKTIFLNGWSKNYEALEGKTRNHSTWIEICFVLKCQSAIDGCYYWKTKIEFPVLVDIKYVYRAIMELKLSHNVTNNITDAMLLQGFGQPPTLWERLVIETE